MRGRRTKKQPKINGYTNHPEIDYVETDGKGDAVIGKCEILGRRDEQEDRMVTAHEEVADLKNLDDKQIEKVFSDTFADITKKTAQYNTQGTTCVSATAWVDPKTKKLTTCTANLGDSEAILVIITKTGEVKTRRLNKLHNPSDETEAEYIKKKKGFIIGGRLNGDLAVSRAFGDNRHEDSINHEPEISIERDNLDEGDRAFIVVGCDGITDPDPGAPEKDKSKKDAPAMIGEIVRKNKDKPVEEIAQAVVAAAHARGVRDNFSAAVFRVTSTPTSVTVCDGHGGKEVAEVASSAFYPTLKDNIKLVAAKKVQLAVSDKAEVGMKKPQKENVQQSAYYIVGTTSGKLTEKGRDLICFENEADLNHYLKYTALRPNQALYKVTCDESTITRTPQESRIYGLPDKIKISTATIDFGDIIENNKGEVAYRYNTISGSQEFNIIHSKEELTSSSPAQHRKETSYSQASHLDQKPLFAPHINFEDAMKDPVKAELAIKQKDFSPEQMANIIYKHRQDSNFLEHLKSESNINTIKIAALQSSQAALTFMSSRVARLLSYEQLAEIIYQHRANKDFMMKVRTTVDHNAYLLTVFSEKNLNEVPHIKGIYEKSETIKYHVVDEKNNPAAMKSLQPEAVNKPQAHR